MEQNQKKDFIVTAKTFDVLVKLPIHQGKHFLKLARSINFQ
jgi:hypothetical protein